MGQLPSSIRLACCVRILSLLLLLLPLSECANSPAALSVTPSTNWYGYDGAWSAISLRLGTPEQWVDVIPHTLSSEQISVGIGGCNDNSLCISNRGGIFNSSESSSWEELGYYDLGVNKELGNTGYANYGLDSLTFGSTGITLPATIIGTVNSTYQWLGSFGLGTTPGDFDGKSPQSPLSALVEQNGAIQSHTYGYTAGAKYRQKGIPSSLTLGGYDRNRFVAHSTSFALNPSQQPQTYINSILVASSAITLNNWTTPAQLLSRSNRVSAIIDSSTPYLWFPQDVCDVFAQLLGLSYNSSLNLYTFDSNPAQLDTLRDSQLTFTFSISDLATSSTSVNITLPYESFDLQLTYPAIPNSTYSSEDSSKFYFPLRQARNEAQYRIGRVFLQEAYLITNYERNTFSIHQAVHTSDPISNTSIVAIPRDSSTTFSGPPSTSKKLSTGVIAGIVVGIILVILILSFLLFWLCRRRKQGREDIGEKAESSTQPRSMFSRFLGRGRSPLAHEMNGNQTYAAEVGADATHERFELPAPLGPAELDSESGSSDGSSPGNIENMSAYDIARRKLERQQAGARSIAGEKTDNDVSQVAHYRAPETNDDISLVSPLGDGSEGTMSYGQPSPMTPAFPSRENFPPPTYRRINPAHVVYAGRLPDNVQLPQHVPNVIGRDGRTIRNEPTDSTIPSPTEAGHSTLGSQYTINETNDLYGDGSGNQHLGVSPVSNDSGSSGNQQSTISPISHDTGCSVRNGAMEPRGDAPRAILDGRRLLDGEDLVHIPQLAENRFSWEEERISGNDSTR